jgi:hypothetical protein
MLIHINIIFGSVICVKIIGFSYCVPCNLGLVPYLPVDQIPTRPVATLVKHKITVRGT